LHSLYSGNSSREDWLTFDSTVLIRYGEQDGAKKGYNPKKDGRPSHHPLIAFLNKRKYVVHLWNYIADLCNEQKDQGKVHISAYASVEAGRHSGAGVWFFYMR
jgi:hypothetical protein